MAYAPLAAGDTALAAPVVAGDTLARLLGARPAILAGQSATQLADGQWLILGGGTAGTAGQQAWLIDTAGKRKLLAAGLHTARAQHSATLLPDGGVLIFGGKDASGTIMTNPERYDPVLGSFTELGRQALTARSGHSATVLSDGRVLIAGGNGANGLLSRAEIYNPQFGQVELLDGPVDLARAGAGAALLPDGQVMWLAGTGRDGQALNTGVVYQPGATPFHVVTADAAQTLARSLTPGAAPALQTSLPLANATGVPVAQRLMMRFTQRMAVASLNTSTVSLIGPNGPVAIRPVALEGGVLLFVTPVQELLPGSSYTLFVQGATDQFGQVLPLTALGFKTAILGQSAAAVAGTAQAVLVAGTDAGAGSGVNGTASASTTAAVGSGKLVKAVAAAAAKAAAEQSGEDDDVWVPPTGDKKGRWKRGNRASSKQFPPKRADLQRAMYGYPELMKLTPADVALKKIPNVQPAASGVTGVAGQVLRLDGKPLVGATMSVGGVKVQTDSNGEFLLAGLPAGRQVLVIDGDTGSSGNRHYGRYEYGVNLEEGHTTLLPFVIWMTRLNPQTVKLASPTQAPLVVTNPQIPGMELRIPAGMVIRDSQGKIVTEISMTAIPVDQPPFPLPHISVPVYFTIQPGGSHLEGIDAGSSRGAQLIYPNYPNAAPGTRMTFWDYDAIKRGWFEYGRGTVTPDGKQVMPDEGVRIYEFSGAMITTFTPETQAPPVGPPKTCPCATEGDPVDAATGLFLNEETDLAIPDVIPITITRSYRQGDLASRGFGVGTNLSYDMFLVGGYDTAHDLIEPYSYLVFPDGSRAYFTRVSGGTGYADAVFQSTAVAGRYYGAIIKWDTSYAGADWSVTLKDGTVFYFPGVGDGGGSARYAAMVGMHDRYGNTMQFIRTNSNLTQIISPNGRNVYLTYDAANRITQISDDLQRVTKYDYDTVGRLVKVTDPEGKSEQFTYVLQTLMAAHSIGGVQSSHNMMTVVDKNGATKVTNVYDDNGRVIKQTYADGRTFSFAYTLLSSVQTITSPAFDTVIQADVTDERGTVTRYIFNSSGAPTSIIKALGLPIQQTQTYNWDAVTNLIDSDVDSLGRTTAYEYDSLGNRTKVIKLSGTPDAISSTTAYDLNYSLPTLVTDANNNATTLNYDSIGNLIRITDALGHSAVLDHDGQGRLISVKDALNHMSLMSYSGADVQSITDALGHTTTMFADVAGRRTSITDALGNRQYFSYDGLDRFVKLTDAKGGVSQIRRDGNGNVLSQIDQNNNANSYQYDGRNRGIISTDALGNNVSAVYEAGGLISQSIDKKGQVTNRTYDELGRLKLITFASSAVNAPVSTITFDWDVGNRLIKIVDSVSGSIARSYDLLDRMTAETTPQGSISYMYDAGGRRTGMQVAGQSKVGYFWNVANRLLRIEQAGVGTGVARQVNFDYDLAGRRIKTIYPNGIVGVYSYNDANQLTGISYNNSTGNLIGNLTYTYDAVGRRSATGGLSLSINPSPAINQTKFNAVNELVNLNDQTLNYDANGNLLSDGTNTYVWNVRNQLESISGAVTASFQYDAIGRRIGKTIGSTSTGYLYDGLNFVQERSGSGSGSPVMATLLNGPGLDELYERQTASGPQTMLGDALGSIVYVTDAAQTVITSYTYDTYGNTTQVGVNDNSQQFTGRENDQTGLYYYRSRYYKPSMGRFISADSLGWASGQTNNYAYVGDDPMNAIDPSGHIPVFLITGAIGGAAGFIGSVGWQLWRNGGHLSCVKWGDAGIAAVTGAVAGALLPVTATTWVGAVATGAVTNAIGYGVTQAVNGETITGRGVATAVVAGGVGGAVAGSFTNPTMASSISAWASDAAVSAANSDAATIGKAVAGAGVGGEDPWATSSDCGCQ